MRMCPPYQRHCLLPRALSLLLLGLLVTLAGCTPPTPSVQAPDQSAPAASAPAASKATDLLVVDCLLPGQIRKLGRTPFLTARRPIKTAAQDCEIRGGEYVSYDRADYRTALNVWLPQAQEGDKEAQTYVGEIYEKGLGVPPDYAVAVAWYRKAADQGHTRAQINLGHMYEKGLGVAPDPMQAVYWYRQASGLRDVIALDTSGIKWDGGDTPARQELQGLKQEVERWKQETATLRQQLEQRQQQLEHTQQELERRQRATDTERQQLTQARQELEQRKQQTAAAARDDAEVKRLEGQLRQREAELARQLQTVTRLQQDKALLEAETASQQARIAEVAQPQQPVTLAGPTIDIVDPPVVRETRGLAVAQISADIVGQQREVVGKVTAPAGVLTLTVNDRPARLDDRGLFRVPVAVQGPSVPVRVVAVDRQGKNASIEVRLTVDGASVATGQAPQGRQGIDFGTYHALIIGNKAYTHLPRLETPENDARTMDEILRRKYGFKTKVLLDATRFDIIQALNDLRKTLTEKDNLLLYYAGHGHWEQQIQRGYWIPVDGHRDSDVNWISTVALTDILSAMSARHVLVVADSCYSGALTRSALARLEAGMTAEAREHWLRTIAEKKSRTVLSSGGLQPVLDSGGGDHSVFAKAFLDVLTSNAEILEGQRLGLEVAARVSYAAASILEQDPQYAPLRYAGHEAGDFLFVPTGVQ